MEFFFSANPGEPAKPLHPDSARRCLVHSTSFAFSQHVSPLPRNSQGVTQIGFANIALNADMIVLATPEMAGMPYVVSGLVAVDLSGQVLTLNAAAERRQPCNAWNRRWRLPLERGKMRGFWGPPCWCCS